MFIEVIQFMSTYITKGKTISPFTGKRPMSPREIFSGTKDSDSLKYYTKMFAGME